MVTSVSPEQFYLQLVKDRKFLDDARNALTGTLLPLRSARLHLKNIEDHPYVRGYSEKKMQYEFLNLVKRATFLAAKDIEHVIGKIQIAISDEFNFDKLGKKIVEETAAIPDFQTERNELVAINYVQTQGANLATIIGFLTEVKNACKELANVEDLKTAAIFKNKAKTYDNRLDTEIIAEIKAFIIHLTEFHNFFKKVMEKRAERLAQGNVPQGKQHWWPF